jgi:predicted acyltransferase
MEQPIRDTSVSRIMAGRHGSGISKSAHFKRLHMKNSPETKQDRLLSLDTLRGFDMFWIAGGEYLMVTLAALTGWPLFQWAAAQMEHVEWEGFRFYDMIFPLFLFIAGVSMPFSILKRQQRGESMRKIYNHLLKRLFLLILLGLIYNGLLDSLDFDNARYSSVLARIGIAWFFAAVIVLNTNIRGQVIWFIGILLGYYAIMKLVPVPGFGAGDLTPEGNLAAFIDQKLLPGRLCCYTYGDNEGLLSHIPAICTALLGVFAGHLLISTRKNLNGLKKALILLAAGIASLAIGKIWSLSFPIIKNLWTSSFVLFAGGWSLILLSVFYLVIDVWKMKKWTFPFVVIGLNSITIYMLNSGIMDFEQMGKYFFGGLAGFFSEPAGQVILVSGSILCMWTVLYILYRNRIFLKV